MGGRPSMLLDWLGMAVKRCRVVVGGRSWERCKLALRLARGGRGAWKTCLLFPNGAGDRVLANQTTNGCQRLLARDTARG